jgi:hypothetical protein
MRDRMMMEANAPNNLRVIGRDHELFHGHCGLSVGKHSPKYTSVPTVERRLFHLNIDLVWGQGRSFNVPSF